MWVIYLISFINNMHNMQIKVLSQNFVALFIFCGANNFSSPLAPLSSFATGITHKYFLSTVFCFVIGMNKYKIH